MRIDCRRRAAGLEVRAARRLSGQFGPAAHQINDLAAHETFNGKRLPLSSQRAAPAEMRARRTASEE